MSQVSLKMPLLGEGRKRKWSYSSLLFSLFYFVPLIFTNEVYPTKLTLIIALYFAFVGLYLLCINVSVGYVKYCLFGLSLIALSSSTINYGGASIFGFASFVLGYYYRFSIGFGVVFIFLLLASLVQHYIYTDQLFYILFVAINIFVLFGFGVMERSETIARAKDDQHRQAISRLSTVAERERIGRDLHDVAGHALSGISLKAQVAGKLLDKGKTEQARAELTELASLAQKLLSEIRQTVSDIKKLSLQEELDKIETQLGQQNIDTEFHIQSTTLGKLTPIQETQVALVLKESITNILRHSSARSVGIDLIEDGEMLTLIVQDKGSKQNAVTSYSPGNGIGGMHERAQLMGGVLTVRPYELGTIVQLQFPSPQPAKSENT